MNSWRLLSAKAKIMHEATRNVIDDLAHTRVADCYQCGKCTAGCPVAEWMDVVPNRVIRVAQTGRPDGPAGGHEEILSCAAIWLCVSCQTCSERCPKNVDVAGVMDAYRQLSARGDRVNDRIRRTLVFQRAFLDSVRRNGRLNELEMIWLYKSRAFAADLNIPMLFRDAGLAPRLLSRRKLHVRGARVRDRDVVRRIFARCTSPSPLPEPSPEPSPASAPATAAVGAVAAPGDRSPVSLTARGN